MKDVIVIALVIAGILSALSVVVRLPPRRRSLDQQKPRRDFHGLVLFGRDGAYVEFDQKSTGDYIVFAKRCRNGDDWIIEVTVSSMNIPVSFLGAVKSGLTLLGSRYRIESEAQENNRRSKFDLVGSGVKDHHALESVARLVVRCLKHPENSKYRVEFKGPKDYQAADTYFEKLKKQWKGEEE